MVTLFFCYIFITKKMSYNWILYNKMLVFLPIFGFFNSEKQYDK